MRINLVLPAALVMVTNAGPVLASSFTDPTSSFTRAWLMHEGSHLHRDSRGLYVPEQPIKDHG
jgi:hypothetical protein